MEFQTEKVEGLRRDSGITKKALSSKLNFVPKTYRLKIQGENEFTANEIAILCMIFNVSPSYFFTDKVSN